MIQPSMEKMAETMGVSREIYELGERTAEKLEPRFREVDRTAEYNQMKVVAAFQKNRISAEHFNGSTG